MLRELCTALIIFKEDRITYNVLVSKRMVKKQQMRWTQKGAHLLLQVRTRVLNDELRDVFRQWYPNFPQGDENQRLAA